VGELIGENESLVNNPVFRHDETELIERNESGSESYSISQQDLSKQMDTFMVRFIEHSDSLNLFSQCNGQVFAYLQSGELQFDIDNKSYVVQKGDTLFSIARKFNIDHDDLKKWNQTKALARLQPGFKLTLWTGGR